jgi:hypothetical protein
MNGLVICARMELYQTDLGLGIVQRLVEGIICHASRASHDYSEASGFKLWI